MDYPKNQKVNGEAGFNGFELTKGKTYLIYRLEAANCVIAKAMNSNLRAYHYVADSDESASRLADQVRSLNRNMCAYIDFEQHNGIHQIFLFCRDSKEDIEVLLNQHARSFDLQGEYDLTNKVELLTLIRACHECCIDNESALSGKRYFNKSQLNDVDKQRILSMSPTVSLKIAA